MWRAAVGLGAALTLTLVVSLPGGGSDGATASRVATNRSLSSPAASLSEEPVAPGFPRFVRDVEAPTKHHTRAPILAERRLLLSFDDGPELDTTPLVLAELDRRGQKAIFFVTGHNLIGETPAAHARRDLVRLMAAHGHLVANHTLHHKNLCKNPGAIAEEVDGNQEIIAAATGIRPPLFRSPYGVTCRALAQALRDRDLIQVGWNIDPQEWRGKDTSAVVGYVTQKLEHLPGTGILLLHDTHPKAVRALSQILDWVDAENARARAGATRPIHLVNYAELLPARPLPASGLEVAVTEVGRRMAVLPQLESWGSRLVEPAAQP